MTAVCKRGYWMCCSVRRGASGASPALVLLWREFLACLRCCRVGMWCSEWCMRMRQIRNLRKCGCRWLGGDGQLRPRGVVDAGHVEERFPDDCGSVHYRGSTLQPAVLCLGPRPPISSRLLSQRTQWPAPRATAPPPAPRPQPARGPRRPGAALQRRRC